MHAYPLHMYPLRAMGFMDIVDNADLLVPVVIDGVDSCWGLLMFCVSSRDRSKREGFPR